MSGHVCPGCGVGRCQPIVTPFVLWANEQMVTVPNAPAFKCDFCFQVVFDPAFVHKIEYAVWQEGDARKLTYGGGAYGEKVPRWQAVRKG